MGTFKSKWLFTQRMVSACITLPEMAVEVDMIVAFNRLLDRHMDIEGRGLCAGR